MSDPIKDPPTCSTRVVVLWQLASMLCIGIASYCWSNYGTRQTIDGLTPQYGLGLLLFFTLFWQLVVIPRLMLTWQTMPLLCLFSAGFVSVAYLDAGLGLNEFMALLAVFGTCVAIRYYWEGAFFPLLIGLPAASFILAVANWPGAAWIVKFSPLALAVYFPELSSLPFFFGFAAFLVFAGVQRQKKKVIVKSSAAQ